MEIQRDTSDEIQMYLALASMMIRLFFNVVATLLLVLLLLLLSLRNQLQAYRTLSHTGAIHICLPRKTGVL